MITFAEIETLKVVKILYDNYRHRNRKFSTQKNSPRICFLTNFFVYLYNK